MHRWQALLDALGDVTVDVADLERRYSEPHRRYHACSHLDALAADFARVAAGPGWEHPTEVAAAVLYHDAIYAIGRPDNEEQSAVLAEEALAGQLDVELVGALIRATAAHAPASDDDTAHFLDCDMAILGAEPDAYDAYERAVFGEYTSLIPAAMYWPGRAAFLRKTLDGPPVFASALFRPLEGRARDNLERALAQALTAS